MAVVAVVVIAVIELLIAVWLRSEYRSLQRWEARLSNRTARAIAAVLDASDAVSEPEQAVPVPGRHAARFGHGRHAASPPADLGSYDLAELNGAEPRPGA